MTEGIAALQHRLHESRVHSANEEERGHGRIIRHRTDHLHTSRGLVFVFFFLKTATNSIRQVSICPCTTEVLLLGRHSSFFQNCSGTPPRKLLSLVAAPATQVFSSFKQYQYNCSLQWVLWRHRGCPYLTLVRRSPTSGSDPACC